MRGTVSVLPSGKKCGRITPACAGNSLVFAVNVAADWDHPRVCGEQLDGAETVYVEEGSPPRVRGTEAVAEIDVDGTRITPACAGNSQTIGHDKPEV